MYISFFFVLISFALGLVFQWNMGFSVCCTWSLFSSFNDDILLANSSKTNRIIRVVRELAAEQTDDPDIGPIARREPQGHNCPTFYSRSCLSPRRPRSCGNIGSISSWCGECSTEDFMSWRVTVGAINSSCQKNDGRILARYAG